MWTIQSSVYDKNAKIRGFSVAELLVVLAIIGIMSAISLPYIYSNRALYKSEEQAIRIMDLMREAAQTALNERRTIRFEIDATDSSVRIIEGGGVASDKLIKRIPLESSGVLRMDVNPDGILRPNPPNYPAAVFAVDSLGHMDGSTPVVGHNVWAIRFRSDGSVVTAGNVPVSATVFIFPPGGGNTTSAPSQVRGITLYGGSGAVRFWRYNGTSWAAR